MSCCGLRRLCGPFLDAGLDLRQPVLDVVAIVGGYAIWERRTRAINPADLGPSMPASVRVILLVHRAAVF